MPSDFKSKLNKLDSSARQISDKKENLHSDKESINSASKFIDSMKLSDKGEEVSFKDEVELQIAAQLDKWQSKYNELENQRKMVINETMELLTDINQQMTLMESTKQALEEKNISIDFGGAFEMLNDNMDEGTAIMEILEAENSNTDTSHGDDSDYTSENNSNELLQESNSNDGTDRFNERIELASTIADGLEILYEPVNEGPEFTNLNSAIVLAFTVGLTLASVTASQLIADRRKK